MKRYITLAAAFVAASAAAGAQNLDPVIEVTRSYESKLLEAEKPAQEMAVPDSLLRFDLDFNYSIFEHKYAGAADFQPYLMDMKPSAAPAAGKRLYLRLGAGYLLHPTFDLVFSPETPAAWDVNIYASNRSYFGNYRNIDLESDGSFSVLKAAKDVSGSSMDKTWSGYDSKTRAGVDGRYAWDGGGLSFGAGYLGIHTKDGRSGGMNTSLNALDGFLRVASNDSRSSYFFYDGALGARFGSEAAGDLENLGLGHFDFLGTFGPVIGTWNSILVEGYAGFDTYSGPFKATIGNFYVVPKYRFERGGVHLSLGVKIGTTSCSNDAPYMGFDQGRGKGQIVYPDVYAGYEAIPERLNLYAKATGGVTPGSYYSNKEQHHFFNPEFGRYASPLLENSVERFNVVAGIQGNVASLFRYDLSGGFAIMRNGLLDAMASGSGAVAYQDYNLAHAEFSFAVDAKPVLMEGSLSLKSTNIFGDEMFGFEPAVLSGDVRARYNWSDRIIGGVSAGFASSRRGYGASSEQLRIPGFLDLGLSGEYAFTRRLSFWAGIGNLLNMTIQRHPGYAESGISLTGGIVFTM